jgi:hypothetical protein
VSRFRLVFAALSLGGCAGAVSGQPALAPLQSRVQSEARFSPPARAKRIYVSDRSGNIFVYRATATGSEKPVAVIAGSQTYLGSSAYLFIARGFLWVSVYAARLLGSVEAFPLNANGNVAPAVRISGSATRIAYQSGVYVTARGSIISASTLHNAVCEFAPGASGNVAPERTLDGAPTQLDDAAGLAIEPSSSNLFVVSVHTSSVLVFDYPARGHSAPLYAISGSNTQMNVPLDVTFDATGAFYVANFGAPAVLVFAPGATGNAAPVRTIAGSNTGLYRPSSVRVDGAGYLYVADNASVKVFAPGANGNVAPVQDIPGDGNYAGLAIH